MNNDNKKKKKNSPPTTLLHYTSWEAFNGMISGIQNNSDGEPCLLFHASHIYAMNDALEWRYFFDKFYTSSEISKKIKDEIEKERENLGDTYVLSFSNNKKKSSVNQIPMWYMYANGGMGACLAFNYKILCDKTKNYIENKKCQYLNITGITEKAREWRDNMKKKMNKRQSISDMIKPLFIEASICKNEGWKYEDEYRFVQISKDPKYKVGKLGLVAYQEVLIPLKALKTITIGPKANQKVIHHSLQLLHDKFYNNPKEGFQIAESKLKIQ